MKRFINHVDHVAYISRWETVEANAARLEALTDAKLQRTDRPHVGVVLYIDWSAGLEIVAPMPERTEQNESLHDLLDNRGEGVLAVIYGVEDLDAHKEKLEAKGFEISPLWESVHPAGSWSERLLVRERHGPVFMNTWLIYSQIDYRDGEIRFIEVEQETAHP
ncbi:hypothetical protein WG908_13635 [Sphingobium sp. AN641]|uniref:hypothetical protein n=1 Tax=Sphingobium sp. AN641 TaxID=3133443 RepID=UPI0030BC07A7